MKVSMYIIVLILFGFFKMQAQDVLPDSIDQAKTYYQLAIKYKDGNGVPMDYVQAFKYFTIAANMGDAQSIYAIAYLHYKGLGCVQDYKLASKLFAEGAAIGKDNSMYFYGLCLRNGYGVSKNEDSARYWLQKSADLGYKQAVWELKMPSGENSNDSAKALLKAIKNAALPEKYELNRYTKIDNHLPPAEIISGYYKGYIIQYDWSGQNAVSSKKLALTLHGKSNALEGYWKEEGIDSFLIKANLSYDSLIFKSTKYGRKDHYSPDSAVKYNFQNAKLNLVQKADTIFLAGNIEMFSPERKEPSKPLMVALYRLDNSTLEELGSLRVSPNPFNTTLNVEFTILKATNVEIQLLTVEGNMIYRNSAGKLNAGHYLLPLQPGLIAHGTYLLKILYGNSSAIVKVIKG